MSIPDMIDNLEAGGAGLMGTTAWTFVWTLIKIVVVLLPLMGLVAYLVLWERKLIGWIQIRIGPNRAGPAGLLQPVADGVKLLLKEVILPPNANNGLSLRAPVLVLTPALAASVHADALQSFKRKHYSAGNATLIMVGNFDLKSAEKLARDTFGGWDKGAVDKPVDPTPYKRTGPSFVGVTKSKPDQQITMTIAYPAPAGVDGQEGARQVLASMMNTRAENVRFKRGSTYGLYFARRPHVGPSSYILRGGAVIGGTVDAERAGESLKAIRDSLDEMR